MSLVYISQQLTIYIGIFLLVTGIIGNGMNIFVFSTIRTYRTTPCSFYFLMNSINNFLYITVHLTSRIISSGFGIDLTRASLVWCKTRNYLLVILSLISFTCSCLAAIDQFVVTSRNVNFRRYSNIKWAQQIVFIVIVVSCLHGIPSFIYLNISPITQTCINTNTIYTIYLPIYSLTLTCIFPIVIMLIFGYLTYCNIRLTRILAEQQADRQLVAMTLFQILIVVISHVPYGINQVYGLITSSISKDTDRLLTESFITTIMIMLTYVYYSGSCSIFIISSDRFRRSVKNRILFRRKPNQIIPVQLHRNGSVTIKNTAANI